MVITNPASNSTLIAFGSTVGGKANITIRIQHGPFVMMIYCIVFLIVFCSLPKSIHILKVDNVTVFDNYANNTVLICASFAS